MVQDHWGGADHSGIVPSFVGQKRRKEICTIGKGCDSVHRRSRALQHQDTSPHQDLSHSATSSFFHRKCLTIKALTFAFLTTAFWPWKNQKKKKKYCPISESLCVYEIFFSFLFLPFLFPFLPIAIWSVARGFWKIKEISVRGMIYEDHLSHYVGLRGLVKVPYASIVNFMVCFTKKYLKICTLWIFIAG